MQFDNLHEVNVNNKVIFNIGHDEEWNDTCTIDTGRESTMKQGQFLNIRKEES